MLPSTTSPSHRPKVRNTDPKPPDQKPSQSTGPRSHLVRLSGLFKVNQTKPSEMSPVDPSTRSTLPSPAQSSPFPELSMNTQTDGADASQPSSPYKPKDSLVPDQTSWRHSTVSNRPQEFTPRNTVSKFLLDPDTVACSRLPALPPAPVDPQTVPPVSPLIESAPGGTDEASEKAKITEADCVGEICIEVLQFEHYEVITFDDEPADPGTGLDPSVSSPPMTPRAQLWVPRNPRATGQKDLRLDLSGSSPRI